MRATFLAIVAVLGWVAVGCEAPAEEAVAGSTDAAVSTSAADSEPAPADSQVDQGPMPADGDEVAVIETNHGRIVLMFFPDKAPGHVKNFKDLANKKFYDGTKFHRVIPGFMIQGGDPNSKTDDRSSYGTGDPGYTIKAEFNDVKHVRGVLSMARSNDPDSAGSQFFIMHDAAPFLDGQYTAFGRVVEGLAVVDTIVNLPRDGSDNPLESNQAIMNTVRIAKWPLK